VRHALAVDEKCDFYRQACLQGSMLVLRLLSGSKMGFCSKGAIHCSNKCEIWHEGAVLLPNLTFVVAKMWQYSADTVKISYFAHKIDKTSLVPYFVKAA